MQHHGRFNLAGMEPRGVIAQSITLHDIIERALELVPVRKREHLSAADLKAGLADCLIEPAKVTAMAGYDNDSIDAVLNQAFAVSMD